ncbi:hypothetical protein [Aliidiomarina soli]|uniref:Beta-ketoacyl synthase N-terminal domain-containing protein n=1 Tax=Aliidiomarina soli TaxID=1928574 RepID=A0A432WIS3_9GAMM|nr:hypothetical protein [Aliidiomarina soli]RUO33726.1 hypothetical protein CWE14_04480 [Aliidiomarina soli]
MQTNIYVTDYGVLLATGMKTEALLLATMARLPLMKVDPTTPLLRPGDAESHLPVQLTCCDNPEFLWEAVNDVVQQKANTNHSVILMLPDPAEPQGDEVNQGVSESIDVPGVTTAYPGQLFTQFERALDQLQRGDIDLLTCIGVDSLVSHPLMAEWLRSGRLRTQQYPDGRAVGEGMGWFTLGLQPGQDGAVQFYPGAWTSEPVHQRSKEYQGLALSVAPFVQSILTEEPDSWVYSRCQTPDDTLQAFMGFQYHWGNRNYKRLEQLFPARQAGDLGVAAWPVAVALACERLAFTPSPKQTAIVSESHPDGQHRSVLLRSEREQPQQRTTGD